MTVQALFGCLPRLDEKNGVSHGDTHVRTLVT
jgi:hypothetical protein